MHYWIGVDEAGYGPNLGPLVISATLWATQRPNDRPDWFKRLKPVVCSPDDHDRGAASIVIGDSKRLYKPRGSLAALERGVLSCLEVFDRRPKTWRGLWQQFAPTVVADMQRLPWYVDYDEPLPLDVTDDEVCRWAAALRQKCETQQLRLLAISSCVVLPAAFNRMCDHFGSKGSSLTDQTLQLIAGMVAPLEDGPITIVADKHGGRNRYLGPLQAHFPDALPRIVCEGRGQSCYQWQRAEHAIEISFRVGGEAYLPTALASMTSKYLRELAMRAFNRFWSQRVEGLRPTAGYPRDARRWRMDAQRGLQALNLAERCYWRSR